MVSVEWHFSLYRLPLFCLKVCGETFPMYSTFFLNRVLWWLWCSGRSLEDGFSFRLWIVTQPWASPCYVSGLRYSHLCNKNIRLGHSHFLVTSSGAFQACDPEPLNSACFQWQPCMLFGGEVGWGEHYSPVDRFIFLVGSQIQNSPVVLSQWLAMQLGNSVLSCICQKGMDWASRELQVRKEQAADSWPREEEGSA